MTSLLNSRKEHFTLSSYCGTVMNTFRTLRWGSTREAKLLVYRQHGGKDTLANLLTLCEACHHKVHRGELTLKATGVSGHLDVIAQRTMQGKAYLYAALGKLARLTTVYGYQTSAYRKARGLPKLFMAMGEWLSNESKESRQQRAPKTADCSNAISQSYGSR